MLAIVLTWLIIGLAVVAVLLMVAIYIQRFIWMARDYRFRKREEAMLPRFQAFLYGELPQAELLVDITGARDVGEKIILSFLSKLTGRDRDNLVSLAREAGLIAASVKDLYRFDWTKRDLAAMKLGLYAVEDTVTDLTKRLSDQRVEVRYTAARSLGMIETPEAVEALMAILDRPELVDTPRILEIVQSMKANVSETLKGILESEDHPQASKLLAIDLVGDLRDFSMTGLLLEVTKSSNMEKVVRSLKALTKIAAPEAIPLFLRSMSHPDWEVRAQAARAIGVLGIDEGLDLLVDALSDESFWVRRNAAESLAEFGGKGYELISDLDRFEDMFARDMASYQIERANGFKEKLVEVPPEGAQG